MFAVLVAGTGGASQGVLHTAAVLLLRGDTIAEASACNVIPGESGAMRGQGRT
jgi:hypothetical protein